MSKSAALQCACKEVRGLVADISPSTVNRVLCYCDDCQAFLHRLARTDLLDAHGGTDIVQVSPASLSFAQGAEHIVGLRLTPTAAHPRARPGSISGSWRGPSAWSSPGGSVARLGRIPFSSARPARPSSP